MVNNNNIILDEGLLKNVAEIIDMPYPKELIEKKKEVMELSYDCSVNKQQILLAKRPPISAEGRKWLEELRDERCFIWHKKQIFTDMGLKWNLIDNCLNDDLIMNHLQIVFDIKPITPALMINISPNWKGEEITKDRIDKFCNAIENYCSEVNSSRWEKVSYVLEDGHDGDFLHFHGVFHVNPKQLNAVIGQKNKNGKNTSHVGQSNHKRQIKKHFNKEEGFEGIELNIKPTILRTELLIQDKLEYLNPDKKPFGHENKSILMDVKTIVFS